MNFLILNHIYYITHTLCIYEYLAYTHNYPSKVTHLFALHFINRFIFCVLKGKYHRAPGYGKYNQYICTRIYNYKLEMHLFSRRKCLDLANIQPVRTTKIYIKVSLSASAHLYWKLLCLYFTHCDVMFVCNIYVIFL